MKRITFLALVLAVAAPLRAPAATISVLNSIGGMPPRIDVPANTAGNFQVRIRLDLAMGDNLNGLSFRLESLDSDTAFAITGRTVTGLPMNPSGALNVQISTVAELTAAPGNQLSPENALDMGLIGPTGGALIGSGTLMLVDLSHAALAPGDYEINACNCATWNDTQFVDHDLACGPNFDVHVVPEPATLVLLCAGAAALRRRKAVVAD